MTFVFLALPILGTIATIVYSIRSVKKGKRPARAFTTQLLSFLAVAVICLAVPMIASAATGDTAQPADGASASDVTAVAVANQKGLGLIGAALAVGIAGIGGGIAVGGAAPAAIGATSEDPKSFGKAMIFVALGEGIALYGLLISILIWVKV